ncbi:MULTISPECIES: urea ABC transporter ATP-binding subunit UrtE [Chromobacterium]|uniref:ABC transporter ATP-binding protein n=1 Tax=Chromobacterium haemolyticum TaxID=394935 RepID=A0A1W0CZX4_9NEIS|nr:MULTISPECIES: urea ABC transporter ATP-binding subunit UrtE [Chromobacterium]MBK0413358.1 urea ABC transporter ATP-binding subunit UrtE [Chromobacterium haemolyticum]MBO0414460.1 urea ABC transporter ATP-binding subunit UrtE [Chromobacterium haemolyticum]MBO0497681.1 urea ABC transporter ATP-binding subunit UrtE [Chromobacterium haemolyticum]OQS40330.1 ABC transporter ATP-binding protein [Chromobacterium haemolyticum]OQS43121.1 ABC transporter ATP-binding protein [Chromobacterium haemolytic
MLEIDGLEQYYGGSRILRGISLRAETGQITCLLGRNGAGKSTLLKCLSGQLPIRGGRMLWRGEDIAALAPHQRAARGIAYVPQGREIFPRLTVEENLRLGLARFSGAAGRRLPDSVFEMFPVLDEMRGRRGGDLSGGQQQQLAIGRALVGRPSLLMLDEPTEGIQPSIIKQIGAAIRQLAAGREMAILLVEQYYDFAEALADRYLVMARGEVVRSGLGGDMQADGVRGLLAI